MSDLSRLGRLALAAVAAGATSIALAPGASGAAKSTQPFESAAGSVLRDGRSPAPQTQGKAPAATGEVPRLSPNPAQLRRAKAQAEGQVSGGESGGGSPQTRSPLSRAAVFGGLNKPGMAASGSTTPPDTTGAIGPDHYLEFVNGTGITAYDRNLNPVSGPVDLAEFLGYPADSVFDPQIQWDPVWNRWIFVMDDIEEGGETTHYLAYGWSKTANPTDLTTEEAEEGAGAGWCVYFLNTEDEFDDYPKLGHSDSGITIGTNVFAPAFITAHIWSIDKPSLPGTCPARGPEDVGVAGSEAEPLETAGGKPVFTPVPANNAHSSPNSYVVAAGFKPGEPQNQIAGWHVVGAGAGATLVEDGDMEVAAFEVPAPVPQPGTAEKIDSGDTRLTNAVGAIDPDAGQEAVWTQHTIDGPGGRSVVRWYELLPGTQTVRQEGTASDPEQFVFNGAISPSAQGDSAAIDLNVGGETLFPTMHAQSRDVHTPLGEMEGDVLLGTSAGAAVDHSCDISEEEFCRWGDYAGASPDPVVPGVVWGSNQGLAEPDEAKPRWTTRNFALLTDVRAPTAPTITATDPPSPANDNHPKVKGAAEARSTVRIYRSVNCTGPVASQGSAAVFAAPGIATAVADNETAQFSATATDTAGNASACSNSLSYSEQTPPPVVRPIRVKRKQGTAVAAKVARVKGGRAFVRLRCRGANPCRGNLRLLLQGKPRKKGKKKNGKRIKGLKKGKKRRSVTLGRAHFELPARGTKVVPVRLTRKGRALVLRAGRRGLKVKLRGKGVSNRSLRLRPVGKRKRRRHRAHPRAAT